ncbi:MAG: thiamine-phosphate kinase [Kocuria sp.]|nr:thiamine-phosphate kinase [Kocuria sp.]
MNHEHDLKVGDLSEAHLIRRFVPLLMADTATESENVSPYQLLGPGDDCAVVAAPDQRFVISTDTQVQGQDFELTWPSGVEPSGADTGHKCATQNLADAAAMGAVPSALVISLTLPQHTPVRWVEDFARGVRAGTIACGAPQCYVVGGDLGAGREISVTATVTGDLEGRHPVRRHGARPGDMVVLAGHVGRAAAGLDLLRSATYKPGRNASLDALVDSQLRPVSPVVMGAQLAQVGATSMIDVSDGLVRDLSRIAEASGVNMVLEPHALEQLGAELGRAADLLGVDPLHWVLHGGEDHGLLSTLPPETTLPPGVCPIGSVLAMPPGKPLEQVAITEPHGDPSRLEAEQRVWVSDTPVNQLPGSLRERGWDHFEPKDGF